MMYFFSFEFISRSQVVAAQLMKCAENDLLFAL